jgi:hypothetical protein
MAREAGIYHAFDSEGHWDGLTDVKLIEPNPHHNDIVYGEKRIVEILKAFEALVRADERWEQSKRRGVLAFCPYTGKPRHPSDIASDPHGILILVPDQPIRT